MPKFLLGKALLTGKTHKILKILEGTFLKTFEKPLSAAEERFYFNELREGNQKAKETLILRNMRLVAHIVKKYMGNERDVDDMISIGTIGLIKAIATFDETKGSRFSTYAAKCIDNELLMMLRSEKKTMREMSIYEPIGTDREGNEINLLDIIENSNSNFVEDICAAENFKWLYEAMEKYLDEREKSIIAMRYGLCGYEETTQKNIASKLGISRSYVSRIEKRALEKLYGAYNMS